jgi:hypothetical protein
MSFTSHLTQGQSLSPSGLMALNDLPLGCHLLFLPSLILLQLNGLAVP